MGANNFQTQGKFPLYAAEDAMCKVCPSCGCRVDAEETHCWDCGLALADTVEEYDEFANSEFYREVEKVLEARNEGYRFHEIELKCGYYSGVQLYVNEKYEVETMDNYCCKYEFGECFSKSLRRYRAEYRRVLRDMDKIAKEFGFMKLSCVGRFSNGETIYTKVA